MNDNLYALRSELREINKAIRHGEEIDEVYMTWLQLKIEELQG